MRALRLAVLFGGMFVATSLLADKVAATTQGRSIAGFLNADGSLNLPENFSGSLDPAGFRMVQQLGAAPKFVPEKQTSAAKLFGVPGGCNGPVRALARAASGLIYLGGDFTVCDDILAARVVAYDPQTQRFRALGSGASNGVNDYVRALAVSGSDLYVGGAFTLAGGAAANYVARWNGSSWSSLGTGSSNGVSAEVDALAISGAEVLAGGKFTQAGGNSANYVARWNGSAWSALGAANNGVNGSVRALSVRGADVFVGGEFTQAGGSPANYVARWNGAAWASLGSGVNTFVSALQVSGSDLFVGGEFTLAGGAPANYIARWNGNAWSSLGSGVSDFVYALASSGSDLYVGGFLSQAGGVSANSIARWNGSTWASLGTGDANGVNSSVNALVVSGSDLYVGGFFYEAGGFSDGVSANFAARWDGSDWRSLGTASGNGVNGRVLALAVSGGELYVGGEFTQAGSVRAICVARWNGSVWSSLGTGEANGVDNAVRSLAVSGGDLYVGGDFQRAGGAPANYVARWNGSSWSSLGNGTGNGVNSFVHAVAVAGSNVYFAGEFTQAGGAPASKIARWNGSSWSRLATGVDGIALALAVSGNDVYVGGFITTAGGQPANHVARWNGNAWSTLGSGLNEQAHALAILGPDLYVGGRFTEAGGAPAKFVARWTGSTWQTLDTGAAEGVNGFVESLSVSGSDLSVGGSFTQAGGAVANGLARWNGSAWQGLATNTPPQVVTALASDGTSLFANGAGISQTPLPRLESANAGVPANAPSEAAVTSRTGAKIAFSSSASNLVPAESNPMADIFVRTSASGTIARISDFARLANGGLAEAYTAPTLSADGSVVGFQGSQGQISALDKGTGRTVTVAPNGAPGNAASSRPAVSRNGLRISYQSLASNLSPLDSNGAVSDVFITNLQTGTHELLSQGSAGQAANGPSFAPWPNEDGSVVAFITLASNLNGVLVAQKASTVRHAVMSLGNSALARSNIYLSRNLSTNQLGNADSGNVRITPDGRFGVFESLASNLVADDSNGVSDIFRFEIANRQLVRLERFSLSTFGLQGNGASRNPSISDDGRFVTFESDATNLVGLDSNGRTDILVRAVDTRETVRLSRTVNGVQPNGPSVEPSISGDGSTILFSSSASNLSLNDSNNAADVFSVQIARPENEGARALNLTGHWAKASEGGWGLTIAHQGDKLFPNWFTYGADGAPLWLSMAAGANLQTDGSYRGEVYDFRGIPFNQINAAQAFSGFNIVGSATITPLSAEQIRFDYTVNGISMSKTLNALVFSELTSCAAAPGSNAPSNANYTDVWNNNSESGWGVHLTHQKDVVFGVWYTYNASGKNQWVTAITRSDATGKIYSGPLYRPATGTPFNLINNSAAATVFPEVGNVRFTFSDGANMQMSYTLDGVTQNKTMARFQFGQSPTRCSRSGG